MNSRITLKPLTEGDIETLQKSFEAGAERAGIVLKIAQEQAQNGYLDIEALAQETSCHISTIYRAIQVFNTKGAKAFKPMGRPSKEWNLSQKSQTKPKQYHFDW